MRRLAAWGFGWTATMIVSCGALSECSSFDGLSAAIEREGGDTGSESIEPDSDPSDVAGDAGEPGLDARYPSEPTGN